MLQERTLALEERCFQASVINAEAVGYVASATRPSDEAARRAFILRTQFTGQTGMSGETVR